MEITERHDEGDNDEDDEDADELDNDPRKKPRAPTRTASSEAPVNMDILEGNVGDIVQAGGLQNFLISLHKGTGPIASFWIGTKLVVSIGKADLFKTQSHVFDKPAELFMLYRDVMGAGSIFFANGAEARKRRKLIDEVLRGKSLDRFLGSIEKAMIMHLKDTPDDEHVPVYKYMYALCMKISTRLLFGEYFFNDMEVLKFSRNFELCIKELEEIANGVVLDSNSPRTKKYEEAAKEMRMLLTKALQKCKAGGDKALLANVLNDASVPEEQAVDDCVTFAIKGYSLVSAMTWMLYFLATHPELQDSIANEVKEAVDKTKGLSCQALLSMKFDASRFEDAPEDPLAFCPFGFAGKRQCPGQDLSILVMGVFLATLCPVLKFHFVPDQVITPMSALITRPQDEVWVTIKRR
ncbi:hypothetical protein HPB51_013861 [Rhipicephalus microplus]|uniref:Cytochrome n=1 Tax=Rhipicephalus microplus TaxID=6941 RepID=A0A9J6F3Q4_RHIMP|nr:hypothetical protein HPB51_013861 [Rhipicephalus microplus]